MSISIALEGSEGAGKSLLFGLTANLLRDTVSFPLLFKREPGGTDLGENIRQILKTDAFKDMDALTSAFLFSAQRSELFKVEKPFLENNPKGVLLKDRSWLSTVVLQVAEGADPEYIQLLQKPFISIPHKFAIIDIPVEETVVRMTAAFKYSSNREVDWRDKQTQELLGRYRQNYLSYAINNKDRCLILDCFDDPWKKAGILKLEIVESLLKQEDRVLDPQEKCENLDKFCDEAKLMIDLDSERPVLRVYDIEGRRKEVEEVRQELGYPSREELRQKMHEEWNALGLEGVSSGIERGK